MDALADVLDLARVSGSVLAHVHAQGSWGLDLRPPGGAAFHAVTAGSIWLQVDGSDAMQLMPGDLVLLPAGMRHQLLSSPGAPTRVYDEQLELELTNDAGDLVIPGTGTTSRFLCAGFSYDSELAQPLLALLPPVLFASAARGDPDSPTQSTLRILMSELGRKEPASRAIVERLIEVLFVHVLRAWLETADESMPPSWLKGLRDPAVGRALALLHERPERAWTTEELARRVHLSRSTLIRRFGELVGEPPLSYLAGWRMTTAARLLRETGDPIGRIARRVGYTSEFAFSRAFSRRYGEPPGRYRRASPSA
ncbi:MAG TPA: AraC family transcriptional regulator [Gaiellaceae bacterium]|nr:AraC family transcriptional regulator [Gaiellaceae bacterium]